MLLSKFSTPSIARTHIRVGLILDSISTRTVGAHGGFGGGMGGRSWVVLGFLVSWGETQIVIKSNLLSNEQNN